MATSFSINGESASTEDAVRNPAAEVIRENIQLDGTAFRCGAALRRFWFEQCYHFLASQSGIRT
jgi:aerobic-type carbon monoxide dehydrogenase small subunit (CoxS/CutS family)